jgi:hypothetical protein
MADTATPAPTTAVTPNGNGKPAGFQVQAATPGADPSKPSQTKVIVTAPFQISPVGQKDKWIKILVYGQPGAGKTELLGSAVDCESMRDVLHINAEAGTLTLQESPRIQNGSLIDEIPVTSFLQVAAIQEFLTAHCKHRDTNNLDALRRLQSQVTGTPVEEIENPKKYRTVIMDTLSEIETYSQYALQGLDQMALITDPNKIETLEFKEYNQNNIMTKMLIRGFRDLPIHFLCATHVGYVQDERKKFHYAPALTGKLATQVQGMFDLVGYLAVAGSANDKGELDRALFIQPGEVNNARYDAKNRLSRYRKAFWENPTLEMILRDTGLLRA